LTTTTSGNRINPATGSISRRKSKLSFANSAGLVAFAGAVEKERVAVRRRAHHGLGRDIGAGAGPAVDYELLAEPLRQPLPDHTRRKIGGAAGRVADDEMDGSRRIGVRQGNTRRKEGARHCGKCRTRSELQKSTARQCHALSGGVILNHIITLSAVRHLLANAGGGEPGELP
jgi:hypothetical protein